MVVGGSRAVTGLSFFGVFVGSYLAELRRSTGAFSSDFSDV
jgi:hypothetical protein